MKKVIALITVLVLSITAFAAGESQTMTSNTIENEFVLVSPIQTGGVEYDVSNLRLGLIYSNNQDVSGIDANWLVSNAKSFNGTRLFGALNMDAEGGKQNSILTGINYSKGNVSGNTIIAWASINKNHEGIRISGVNFTKEKVKGTDIGFVNYANKTIGFQFGIVNWAEELDGMQIGLINYAKNSTIFPVLPFFNKGGN